MVDENVVLFSGYAKLPSGTVSGEVYKVMALVMLIDVRNGTIIDADCTLSTRLSERFVLSMIIGKNIKSDNAELVDQINRLYQGSAKKAIINALRVISAKYSVYMQAAQNES
ncbi:MAG: DUF3870 domain-containing protein [Sporomusaceae bacterium]|nr:DUF3870 domain-containing protein [Sporomusaceae bacterium]